MDNARGSKDSAVVDQPRTTRYGRVTKPPSRRTLNRTLDDLKEGDVVVC